MLVLTPIICYKKRKTIMYWYHMARGKAVAAKYLCYEGDEWDKKNTARERKKGNWLDDLLVILVSVGPYPAIFIYLLLGASFSFLGYVAGLFLVGTTSQIWKFARSYQEQEKYGGSLNLRLFYQYPDGREGEVLLERCRISDRIVSKPRELITNLEVSEHFIQSGVDERKLMAELGKEYLSEELKTKLGKLEEMSQATDEQTRTGLKSVVILRKFFSFGPDNPELDNLFAPQVKTALNDLRALLKKEKIDTEPALVVQAYTLYKDVSAESLTKLEEGILTPKLKAKLDELDKAAKANDVKAKNLLQKLELVRKFFALGILQEPGQADDVARYEAHIYSILPGDGDLRKRCVCVFPCEFGKAVKNDSKIPVPFDYKVVEAPGSDLEAIRLDETLEELLVNGQVQHGVQIEFPKDMYAVTNNVPVFIITRCDETEEQLRQGMRITMPPSIIGLFTKAVHAVIDHSWLAEKLARAYARIRQLEETKEEERTLKETEQTRHDLATGNLIEPPTPTETPPPPPMRPWKLIAAFLVGIAVGAVALYVGLRLAGWMFRSPWGDLF